MPAPGCHHMPPVRPPFADPENRPAIQIQADGDAETKPTSQGHAPAKFFRRPRAGERRRHFICEARVALLQAREEAAIPFLPLTRLASRSMSLTTIPNIGPHRSMMKRLLQTLESLC